MNYNIFYFIVDIYNLIYIYLFHQNIDLELKLLRRLTNDGCLLVSKEYAIMNFKFETKCAREMIWHTDTEMGTTSGEADGTLMQSHMNDNTHIFGCP